MLFLEEEYCHSQLIMIMQIIVAVVGIGFPRDQLIQYSLALRRFSPQLFGGSIRSRGETQFPKAALG